MSLDATLKRMFWKVYRTSLEGANRTYGAAWRKLVRPRSNALVSYGRLLRFARYVHHFDSYGDRVGMGRDVAFWGDVKVHAGKDSAMLDRTHIIGFGELWLGDRASLGTDTSVLVWGQVKIGNDVQVAANCMIVDNDHEFVDNQTAINAQPLHVAPIVIEDDVWIGAHTVILRGVTIGRGAVVGANSVVTKSLPANSICAGSPARVLRMRSADEPPHAR